MKLEMQVTDIDPKSQNLWPIHSMNPITRAFEVIVYTKEVYIDYKEQFHEPNKP